MSEITVIPIVEFFLVAAIFVIAFALSLLVIQFLMKKVSGKIPSKYFVFISTGITLGGVCFGFLLIESIFSKEWSVSKILIWTLASTGAGFLISTITYHFYTYVQASKTKIPNQKP